MRRLFSEFKTLPPNHLRVRVGVGNRIFNNQVHCLTSGYNFWLQLFAHQLCKLDSNIVEIGCGYGRKATHLAKYFIQGERYTGQYLGVDIDAELIKYARKTFPSPQFAFQLTPHKSRTYAPGMNNGASSEMCRLECDSGTQDLVVSTSLFTHLLEPELSITSKSRCAMLKPGGTMQMNIFSYDFLKRHGHLGTRWTFLHRLGEAYVESEMYPEAAVAYTDDYYKQLCAKCGFSQTEIICDPEGKMVQSYLRCRK